MSSSAGRAGFQWLPVKAGASRAAKEDFISSLRFSPVPADSISSHPILAVGRASGAVSVVNDRFETLINKTNLVDGVNDVAWSVDGVNLNLAFESGVVKVWDAYAQEFVCEFKSPGHAATSMSTSPQSNVVAVGYYNGLVSLWDGRLPPARCICSIRSVHEGPITSLNFHPDGSTFVTTGMDGQAVILDVASRKELWKLLASPDLGISCACFSPNGRFLLIRGFDKGGALELWDVDNKSTRVAEFSPSSTPTAENLPFWMTCCFVDNYVVAGFPDGVVRIWDANKAADSQAQESISVSPIVPLAVAGSVGCGGWMACGGGQKETVPRLGRIVSKSMKG